jgi:hypothetical protein
MWQHNMHNAQLIFKIEMMLHILNIVKESDPHFVNLTLTLWGLDSLPRTPSKNSNVVLWLCVFINFVRFLVTCFYLFFEWYGVLPMFTLLYARIFFYRRWVESALSWRGTELNRLGRQKTALSWCRRSVVTALSCNGTQL